MTANKYKETHGLEYEGKHRKRLYRVWRIPKPNGPIIITDVYGYKEARELINNSYKWDISVVNETKSNNSTLYI